MGPLLALILLASFAFIGVTRTEARVLGARETTSPRASLPNITIRNDDGSNCSSANTLTSPYPQVQPRGTLSVPVDGKSSDATSQALHDNDETARGTIQADGSFLPGAGFDYHVDIGDRNTFDGPNPVAGTSLNPSAWRNADGSQKPLVVLSETDREGLWAEALMKGQAIVEMLDEYVPYGISRLSGTQDPRQVVEDFKKYYDAQVQVDSAIETDHEEVNEPFGKVGLTINANAPGFNWVEVKSLTPSPNANDLESVLDVAVNANAGVLISLVAYTQNDGNAVGDRLNSSELTWQVWKAIATALKTPWRGLKYWQRHNILNQETANIMTLAHLKFPRNVYSPVIGMDGKPFGPCTGHGKWLPPRNLHEARDSVFTRLLNTPNIRPIAHLLADHNDELDNPCIAEIHTFPAVEKTDNLKKEDVRMATMIAVLGKCVRHGMYWDVPTGGSGSGGGASTSGTVQTS